jgi:hypothetical protein
MGKGMRTDRWGGGRETDRQTDRQAGSQTVKCRQGAGRHTGSRRSETGKMDIWTSNGLADSRYQKQRWKSDADPQTSCMQIKKIYKFYLKMLRFGLRSLIDLQNPKEAFTPL